MWKTPKYRKLDLKKKKKMKDGPFQTRKPQKKEKKNKKKQKWVVRIRPKLAHVENPPKNSKLDANMVKT